MKRRSGSRHLAVAVHHGVCRAQQNVVMCGVHHWHTMLLQVRRIQNRRCQLTVHVVHVDHIRLELLQQRLKLALGFQRMNQRCRFLCLLECGNFTDVVFSDTKYLLNSLARCSGAAWRRRQLRGLMISGLRRVRKSRFRHRLCGKYLLTGFSLGSLLMVVVGSPHPAPPGAPSSRGLFLGTTPRFGPLLCPNCIF